MKDETIKEKATFNGFGYAGCCKYGVVSRIG